MTLDQQGPTPPSGQDDRFRLDIQGLRGIAVLLVVAFHSGLAIPGGFVGVDVFFVVSGFVITRMLLTEIEGTGGIDLWRFFRRRIQRLLPALSLMLVLVTLASFAFGSLGSLALTARTAAGAALIAANAVLYRSPGGYFDEASESNPLLHTWSLSVEEQFYLLYPGVLIACWRLRRASGRRAALTALALICGVSFSISALMTAGVGPSGLEVPRAFAFYASPTRAWEFGLGALLALGDVSLKAPWRAGAALAGWVLIGGAAILFDGHTPFPGTAALAPTFGAAFLISAGCGAGRPWASRILERAFFVRLGDLSYSWYLWHWPLVVFGRTLFPTLAWVPSAMALLSLAPAWASYAAVETRLRRWTPRSSAGVRWLVVVCVSLPLLGAVCLLGLVRMLPRMKNVATYTTTSRFHLDVTLGCDSPAAYGNRQERGCSWSAPQARGHVVLIGDSNAGQYSEPLQSAAQALGLSGEIATLSACPFLDVHSRRDGVEQTGCRGFVEGSIAALTARPPSIVAIASASDLYIADRAWELSDPLSPGWQEEPSRKAILWAGRLKATIGTLRAAGSAVLLIHPIPRLQRWRARSCALGLVALRPEACSVSRVRDEAFRERQLALVAEAGSAAAAGASTLDVAGEVCGSASCDSLREGIWWYRDYAHLSVDGATKLRPRFREAFQQILQ